MNFAVHHPVSANMRSNLRRDGLRRTLLSKKSVIISEAHTRLSLMRDRAKVKEGAYVVKVAGETFFLP